MTFRIRTASRQFITATLFSVLVLAPSLSAPANAAECVPATTSSWTGDGSDSSTIGTAYTVLTFSSAGTCTWTVPSGVSSVAAFAVGGGGGGAGASGSHAASPLVANSGAAGSGGGGAQISTGSGSVTPGSTLTVVVGAGGARGLGGGGGAAGACGADGGASSISEISLTASGGAGGIGGGQNSSCTAADNINGSGYFLPGAGGDSGTGFTGGSPSGTQAGSGASATTNGGASTAVVPGQTVSFSGVSGTFANGGGGGNRGANYGGSGTGAGSGGGGGREPLYSGSLYWYGYAGSAGVAGTVVVRYITPLVTTSSSPSAIILGEGIPAITYTTSPATVPSDWTTEPTCGVYAADDLTTPLTAITEPGEYVTQCVGGTLLNGGGASVVPGALTVSPFTVSASSPTTMKVGDTLPVVTFSVTPSDYTPSWTTPPTCAIYSESDLLTPVTTITSPGTYVTQCTGGVLSNGATGFTFENGAFEVTAADNNGGGSNGGGSNDGALVLTGWAFATTLALVFIAGLMFVGAVAFRGVKLRLVAAEEDARLSRILRVLNAKLARLEGTSRRR